MPKEMESTYDCADNLHLCEGCILLILSAKAQCFNKQLLFVHGNIFLFFTSWEVLRDCFHMITH